MFVSPRFRDLLGSGPIRAARAKPEFIPAPACKPEFIPAPVFKPEFIPADELSSADA